MKKDIYNSNQNANKYQKQLTEALLQIEKLKKDNHQLRRTVNRYRIMVLNSSQVKASQKSDKDDEGESKWENVLSCFSIDWGFHNKPNA